VRRLNLMLVAIVGCTPQPVKPVDPDAVRVSKLIADKGAPFVLDSESKDEKLGSLIFDRIMTGDSAWLDIARRLKPSSDAGSSEELNTALAFALTKSPERVLELLADSSAQFQFYWVCSGKQSMDDVDTLGGARADSALRVASRAALRSVKSAKLLSVRDSCARMIGYK
jgi:hypothetical protein